MAELENLIMDDASKRQIVDAAKAAKEAVETAKKELEEATEAYKKTAEKFVEETKNIRSAGGKVGPFGETEFKELCASIRHYGGLRYLVIPFYLAIMGAPFIALKNGQKIDFPYAQALSAVVVFLLFCIFYSFERLLNKYLDGLVAYGGTAWASSFLARDRVKRSKIAVTVTIRALYLVVGIATGVFLWFSLGAPSQSKPVPAQPAASVIPGTKESPQTKPQSNAAVATPHEKVQSKAPTTHQSGSKDEEHVSH